MVKEKYVPSEVFQKNIGSFYRWNKNFFFLFLCIFSQTDFLFDFLFVTDELG